MDFETPAKDGTKLADGQHQPLAAEFAQARVCFGLSNLFEPVEEFQLQDDRQLKRKPQDMASVLEFCAAGGVMQTKMTNAHKASGQDMRKKAADKLQRGEGHDLLFASVTVIEILESDGIFANGNNPMIGDCNAEDVATEILDQILFVIERGLDIDFPLFGQGLPHHSEHIECAAGGLQFASLPQLENLKTKAVAEDSGKQFNGKEKLARSRIPMIASGGRHKRPARDDEMEVEMILQGLSPSMQDHRKTDFAAEIVASELLQ